MRVTTSWQQILGVAWGVFCLAATGAAWGVGAQIRAEIEPLGTRLTVVETRRESDSARLERIENKLDALRDKINVP